MNAPLAPSRLLPLPAPPHDPLSTMLSGRIGSAPTIGWRVHRLSNVDLQHGAMLLAPAPAAARWLGEPSGSFGGLRPPANVAVSAKGDVLLLDPATGEIRHFDPCACAFVTVPCVIRLATPIGEAEAALGPSLFAPRDRLLDPQGIAICGAELFIADRGHHRIVRFSIDGWIPRGITRLPAAERAALAPVDWHPTTLAVDGKGQLIVTDPVNGRLDIFAAGGRWLRRIAVPVGTTHIAVDCRDRIVAVVQRTFTAAVAGSVSPVAIEIDAGVAELQWHDLQLSPMGSTAKLAVDVHAGDEPWSAVQLNDPANALWSPWLAADAVSSAVTPLPLGGRAGRHLRIRFRPAPGHVAAPFIVTATGAHAIRISETGVEPVLPGRADLAGDFGTPPICVDMDGRLHLPCDTGVECFDRRGRRCAEGANQKHDRFERQGRFLSTAIDSRIEGCPWHRIELRGAIPPDCSIEVAVTTAELELDGAELDSLPDHAWTACAPARVMERGPDALLPDCTWDALLTPPPGRYLWVRLVLRGDGRQTPCLSAAVIEYPRISLRRYLPGIFGADPAGADFTDRFAAIFERTLGTIEGHLDRFPLYLDPLSAPALGRDGRPDFLSWLGSWIGVALSKEWPEAQRRHFIKQVAGSYALLGTPEGFRRQLLLLLGFDVAYGERCLAERPQRRCVAPPCNCAPCPPCEPAEPPPLLLEHFKLRRWLHLGRGRLGAAAELWGRKIVGRSELGGGQPLSGQAQLGVTALDAVPDPLRDPFHVFAHKVSLFVPARIRAHAPSRRALEQLVARETPAHVQTDIRYVEPRFRVGVQAMIGLDSVIARTPLGVTLDDARLRQGTILTGRPRTPDLRVGDARLGTTTRLT